jgi:hypothetical protein
VFFQSPEVLVIFSFDRFFVRICATGKSKCDVSLVISEAGQTGIRGVCVCASKARDFFPFPARTLICRTRLYLFRLLLPCARLASHVSRGLCFVASAIVITVILSAAAALRWLFRDDSGDGAHDIRVKGRVLVYLSTFRRR